MILTLSADSGMHEHSWRYPIELKSISHSLLVDYCPTNKMLSISLYYIVYALLFSVIRFWCMFITSIILLGKTTGFWGVCVCAIAICVFTVCYCYLAFQSQGCDKTT